MATGISLASSFPLKGEAMYQLFTQRRILGMLTLGLACMCMQGWLKSIYNAEMGINTQSGGRYAREVITITLSLIAAFLLLVKPRQRSHKKLVELIPEGE